MATFADNQTTWEITFKNTKLQVLQIKIKIMERIRTSKRKKLHFLCFFDYILFPRPALWLFSREIRVALNYLSSPQSLEFGFLATWAASPKFLIEYSIDNPLIYSTLYQGNIIQAGTNNSIPNILFV